MKNLIKLLLALLLIFCAAFAIHFVLSSESAQVSNPKGIMAHRQLHVITRNILLMLLVVVPTMVLLFLVAWKYRATNTNNIYTPEKSLGPVGQTMLLLLP